MNNIKYLASTVFIILMLFCSMPNLTAQILILNEIMSSNATTIADEDGDYEDWIELYNQGSEPVALSGFGLSDTYSNPFRWVFPDVTILPGEFLLVWASGKNRKEYTGIYDPLWFSGLDNMAGAWMFDEESGIDAFDASGNNNHGVLYGPSRTSFVPFNNREFGGALSFSRDSSHYVQIPNSSSLMTVNNLTISMWIKPMNFENRQNPWDKAYGGEGTITLEKDGTLNYYWGTSGENAHPYQGFNSMVPILLNTWTHIALVRDLENMTLRWYLNGKQVAATIADFEYATASNNPVRIGKGYAGAFEGSVSKSILFSSALTAESVRYLYNVFSRNLHTNFSISAAGEEVLITHPFGSIIDQIQPIAIPTDISYGRSPDGTGSWFFFAEPTPGQSNATQAYSEILESPVFSHSAGFYTDSLTLSITHPDPDVSICFTLDGSVPDPGNLDGTIFYYKNQYPQNPGDPFGELIAGSYNSYLYSEPFVIHDRSPEPDSITHISSTWHQNPYYFPSEPVFKGTVVRAIAVKEGAISSPVITNSFFINPAGRERYSLPVISLSIPKHALFDYDDGIYVAGVDYDHWRIANPEVQNTWSTVCNFDRRGIEWEIRSHFDYFDTLSSQPDVSQELGVRIHGSEARRRPMKSLRLYARNEYGNSYLNHQFFKNLTDSLFKRLLLRNSGQDFLSTMFRDAAIHKIARGLKFDTQAYTPAVIFINGEFWGIHNIRERYDKYYFQRVYNIDPEDIDYISTDEIKEGDLEHYTATISYITENGLVDDEHYQHIKTRIDTENFRDYQITNIYADNFDWPGNNLEYWRLRTNNYVPGAPTGHDGRWRWLLYDMDFCFGMSSGSPAATNNTLAHATLAGGTSYPNPDWATFLLRKFLENDDFRIDFINRFADLMNTYFLPERVITIINDMRDRIAPEMPGHMQRWKHPQNISTWWYFLQEMCGFANLRPEYQRQHIIEHFNLEGELSIELNVAESTGGYIRINTIEIAEGTPGISDTIYPWMGIYFKGIPIEIEAIPAPGYAFSHWEGLPEGTPPLLSITPGEDLSITAHFIEAVEAQLLYFWIFDTSLPNDTPLEQISARYQLPGEGVLNYHSALLGYPFQVGHPNWRKASMERRNAPTEINYRPEGNNGISYAASNMRGLQIKQPFTGDAGENTMFFHLPTTGYENMILRFAAKDEGAAEFLVIDYSAEPETPQWTNSGLSQDVFPLPADYQLFEVDFSGIEAADDNAHFIIRIRFDGSNMSADDGNRVTFNNFSLDGELITSGNLPPVVENPPGFQTLIESGEVLQFDLNDVFSDPENDPLVFAASSDNAQMAGVNLNGSNLIITPNQRGGAWITLQADDGFNEPVLAFFRVLVYPEAFVLNSPDYLSFSYWDPDLPEYTYPEHMLFLQSDVSDPGLEYPLLYPYYIPHDDYHADDQGTIGFPYNNTGRTRINGLSEDGISFINTGRGRDLGGALLALDTRSILSVKLNWLAETILQNSRIYAIRLQYRTGITEPFSDFYHDGQPLEYIAGEDGDLMVFESIPLPAEILNKEYVQLLWKYYYVSGDAGPRANLRLDEIFFNDVVLGTDETGQDLISLYFSDGSLNIQLPLITDGSVFIYDATGRRIFYESFAPSAIVRFQPGLKSGFYIVQIITGDKVFTQKIIRGLQ